ESPGDGAGGGPRTKGSAGIVNDEAALRRALGVAASRTGLDKPTAYNNVEVNSGRADDQRASRRHREGGASLYLLAGPQTRQDHWRTPGIGRRAHPSIDAEIGPHHHALPIQRRGGTLPP